MFRRKPVVFDSVIGKPRSSWIFGAHVLFALLTVASFWPALIIAMIFQQAFELGSLSFIFICLCFTTGLMRILSPLRWLGLVVFMILSNSLFYFLNFYIKVAA